MHECGGEHTLDDGLGVGDGPIPDDTGRPVTALHRRQHDRSLQAASDGGERLILRMCAPSRVTFCKDAVDLEGTGRHELHGHGSAAAKPIGQARPCPRTTRDLRVVRRDDRSSAARGQVREADEGLVEVKHDAAGGTVPVLGDDDLGEARDIATLLLPLRVAL